jgi:hypothetical protein
MLSPANLRPSSGLNGTRSGGGIDAPLSSSSAIFIRDYDYGYDSYAASRKLRVRIHFFDVVVLFECFH